MAEPFGTYNGCRIAEQKITVSGMNGVLSEANAVGPSASPAHSSRRHVAGVLVHRGDHYADDVIGDEKVYVHIVEYEFVAGAFVAASLAKDAIDETTTRVREASDEASGQLAMRVVEGGRAPARARPPRGRR
jgi:hypothetical protein